MKIVNRNIMVRQAAASIQLVIAILLLADSLQKTTALEPSPTTSILLNTKDALVARRRYDIVCRVEGWLTPPKVSWWLGDQPQTHATVESLISEERNLSDSILQLTPSPDDNGRTLKCRSEGTYGIQEDSVKLLVLYPPIVSLYTDPPVRTDDLREGDDVTFKCRIRANPPAWRVKWNFRGSLWLDAVDSDRFSGSLTVSLASIDHLQAGNYSCVVSNAMGVTESPPLELVVKYPPRCRWQVPLIYDVNIGEIINIDCGGDGVPPPYSYQWTFSRALMSEEQPTLWNTRGPDGRKITFLEVTRGEPWRFYQVREALDYGTFHCSSMNGIGPLQKPCVFYVVPRGKPEAPTNCSVGNETTDSFVVQCPTTTDHGFNLGYQLEVFDASTGYAKFNVTQNESEFLVGGLKPNRAYTMRVAAVSPRGSSEWFRMNTFTLEQPPTTTTTTTVDPGTEEERK